MAREREELRRQQEHLRYEQEKRNNLKRGREVEHGYNNYILYLSSYDYDQSCWTLVETR